MYALCSDVMLKAIRRCIQLSLDASNLCVKKEDFIEAINENRPSVSIDELKRYKALSQLYVK